ncbi:flagellar biosynthetic protein FliO [bacterium]|nr:flagellar biosynthetic protein FliO [bacterium]
MLSFLSLLAEVSTEPLTATSSVDFTWLFFKTMAALIVVCLGAIFVLKYAVPRTKFFRKTKDGKDISILDRMDLAPKKQLYVVKVQEKHILLGVSEHNVNYICDLEKTENNEG